MDSRQSYQWRKQLMWGLVLVAIGVALLLDRMGRIDILELWEYLPLLLVVVGINRMIGYPTAEEFLSGLWWMVIGGWVFANLQHMFGMRFETSWPLLIIVWGLTLMLKPFLRRRLSGNEQGQADNKFGPGSPMGPPG
jgi:Domain of unknown function (DUF5668)